MLGSFPPPKNRWSMDFYYPNRTNMMWALFGMVFMGDAAALVDTERNTFRLPLIKTLLTEKGIAIYDTACAIRRLKGNASDKFLEVVEKTDVPALLQQLPLCHDIVCTGEKSCSLLCDTYAAPIPAVGSYIHINIEGRSIKLHRMPSTSRAYPLPLAKKAIPYRNLFTELKML